MVETRLGKSCNNSVQLINNMMSDLIIIHKLVVQSYAVNEYYVGKFRNTLLYKKLRIYKYDKYATPLSEYDL